MMDLAIKSDKPFVVARVRFHVGMETEAFSKLYEYRTRFDLKPGMSAVVEVGGVLKVVDIVEVVPPEQQTFKHGELKWLVDVIEFEWYINQLKEEAAIEEGMRQLEIEAAARRKVQQVQESFKDDPELSARFQQLINRKKAL